MYGIVEIGGHQYRVREGDIIDVQKLDAQVGSTIDLEKVLFVSCDTPKVGTPTVAGAKVTAEVVRQARSRKVIVFRHRRRAGHMKKNGHRQHYTGLKITSIKA